MAERIPNTRPRARGSSGWSGIVVAAVLSACGSGTPAPRGFGSRLLFPTRDRSVSIGPVGNGRALYQTTTDGGFANWELDLATGQVSPFDWPDGGADAGNGSTGFTCENTGYDPPTNTATVTVTNLQTGQQFPVDGVAQVWVCPTETNPVLTVLRSDSSGTLTLWSGPPDQVALVPLPVTIVRTIVFYSTTSVMVYALAGPDAAGIYAIDLQSFAVTAVIPPTLDTGAWASGATGTGPLTSTTVRIPAATEPNALMFLPNRHFVYERTMSDGSAIVFAGPTTSGPATELALFEVAPSGTLLTWPGLYTSTNANVSLLAFEYQPDPTQPAASLFVWDDAAAQLLACPLPELIATTGLPSLPGLSSADGLASPDGTQLVLGAPLPTSRDDQGLAVGTAVLASMPSAPVASPGCKIFGADHVNFAGFSLTGDSVFWLTDETTLWTASGDGSDARQIGSGAIVEPHFAVGTELEMFLAGDLVWVDATDPSNTVHDVAVHTFGEVYDFGATVRKAEGPWLITGYDLSGQDGTGTLALFNRNDPTATQRISPEVASFKVGKAGPTPDGGVPTLDVVYLVRGRNPSPQDGIWVATIDEATLGN